MPGTLAQWISDVLRGVVPAAAPRPRAGLRLYAFCRHADDAVDLRGEGQAAIAHLRRRLDLAYEGRPFDTPIDRAFAATIERIAIPHVAA